MWIRNQPLAAKFLWHVKHIVDLHDAEMRIQAFESWKIGQDVAAPANVAFSRTEFPLSGCRPIALVELRYVIDAVVWPATEFPNVVRDFDCEAVAQVASHHENAFSNFFPFVY